MVFSPIQGLWTNHVCLSMCVCLTYDNSLQTEPIDLKVSAHLNEAKSAAKFEDMDKIRRKKFMLCVPDPNQCWVYGAKD